MLTKLTRTKFGYLSLIIGLLTLIGIYGSDKITQADASNEDTSKIKDSYLNQVKERGYLICGVAGEVPGFSFVNAEGQYAGLDVDFCRAVASAIFDDPTQVKFVELDSQERFDVLKSGKIDILSRNTTNTLSRDANTNLEFTPTTFYDSQGIMVNKNSDIKNIVDLEGKSICVRESTTSYDNLQDYMNQAEINYQPVAKSDGETLFNDYEHNVCQAITGDISFLIAQKVLLANPNEHQLLPTRIAQEPLAPSIIHQDAQWFDTIKWITFALFQAEELNISSVNLNTRKNSQDLETRQFLGLDNNLGSQMGLSNDFTMRIIKHVGNYQEIYDRNIGQPFGLERGKNALWKNGGLMYSPPFN